MSATTLPDSSALLKASELNVFDSQGKEVKFGTIFEKEKVMVVFIRKFNDVYSRIFFIGRNLGHFFCGVRSYADYLLLHFNLMTYLTRNLELSGE